MLTLDNDVGYIDKLTKRDVIQSVPDRWLDQYPNGHGGNHQVHKQLVSEKPATKDAVEEIIGNNSWTVLKCAICQEDKDAVVIFGSPYDECLRICGKCISMAGNLLRKKA